MLIFQQFMLIFQQLQRVNT